MRKLHRTAELTLLRKFEQAFSFCADQHRLLFLEHRHRMTHSIRPGLAGSRNLFKAFGICDAVALEKLHNLHLRHAALVSQGCAHLLERVVHFIHMLADVIRHLSNELHGKADRRQSCRHVSKRLAVFLLSFWIAIGFTHTVERFAGELKK